MDTCQASCSTNAQHTSGSSGASSDEADAQDEDSSSSSSPTIKSELDQFREAWRWELNQNINLKHQEQSIPRTDSQKEQQASILYMNGVKAERAKDFHEAIFYYRRALKLVPDIEARLASSFDTDETDEEEEEEQTDGELVSDDEESIRGNLYEHIQRVHQGCTTICVPQHEQKSGVHHISCLPPEVFSYILHWVVSAELDLHSLEQCAAVCRGFYLRSRDPEIWRLACYKVWGVRGSSQVTNFPSWREMYIHRPRVCYNGIYISRTTYVRQGDQEYFYKPCYLVAYFRYLRFFPNNNTVLMLTTLDDPQQALDKLRHHSSLPPTVLRGRYTQHGGGNLVSAVLEKAVQTSAAPLLGKSRGRYRQAPPPDPGHQTYHLELELRTVKNRLNIQLAWRHYSVHTVFRNGQELSTTFEITPQTFPPFWFSPVRSYASESLAPLVP